MASEAERRKVLEMIENGKLSAGEGLRLLDLLTESEGDDETESNTSTQNDPPSSSGTPPSSVYPSRLFWRILLWVGVTLVVLGALALFLAWRSIGFGGWFILAGLPLFAGVFLIFLAWESRWARWLRLTIQQKPGRWPQVISFGFPLPLRVITWFLGAFGDKIPSIKSKSLDQFIQALETGTSREYPLYIGIGGEENGERVQLFIG